MHDMITGDFGENKISKELELNETMSVVNQAPDELTNKLKGDLTNA